MSGSAGLSIYNCRSLHIVTRHMKYLDYFLKLREDKASVGLRSSLPLK